MPPRVAPSNSSTTDNHRRSYQIDYKRTFTSRLFDSFQHYFFLVVETIIPNPKELKGRIVQLGQILFVALLALASILVQLYTDLELQAERDDGEVKINVRQIRNRKKKTYDNNDFHL